MLPLRHSTRAFLYSGTRSQTSFPKATPAALPCKDESACRVQRVTKRCRLSWLTNSALVIEPKCEGRGELCGISQLVQQYRGAQINFGDLTPYLTYGGVVRFSTC